MPPVEHGLPALNLPITRRDFLRACTVAGVESFVESSAFLKQVKDAHEHFNIDRIRICVPGEKKKLLGVIGSGSDIHLRIGGNDGGFTSHEYAEQTFAFFRHAFSHVPDFNPNIAMFNINGDSISQVIPEKIDDIANLARYIKHSKDLPVAHWAIEVGNHEERYPNTGAQVYDVFEGLGYEILGKDRWLSQHAPFDFPFIGGPDWTSNPTPWDEIPFTQVKQLLSDPKMFCFLAAHDPSILDIGQWQDNMALVFDDSGHTHDGQVAEEPGFIPLLPNVLPLQQFVAWYALRIKKGYESEHVKGLIKLGHDIWGNIERGMGNATGGLLLQRSVIPGGYVYEVYSDPEIESLKVETLEKLQYTWGSRQVWSLGF